MFLILLFKEKFEAIFKDANVGSKATILLFVPIAKKFEICPVPQPTSKTSLLKPISFLKDEAIKFLFPFSNMVFLLSFIL